MKTLHLFSRLSGDRATIDAAQNTQSRGPARVLHRHFGTLSASVKGLLGAALLCLSPAVCAMVPADTQIAARAYAEYLSADQVQVSRVYSNDVVATVAAVEAFEITGDASVLRQPSSRVTLPFLLKNTGNAGSDYTIELTNGGVQCASDDFDLSDIRIGLDANNNGVIEDSEAASPSALNLHLGAGRSAGLLAIGATPNVAGGQACMQMSVRTAAQNVTHVAATTVGVGAGASIVSVMTARYSGALVPAESVIGLDVQSRNIGSQSATTTGAAGPLASVVQVNGVPTPLVLIRAQIPDGTRYVTGSLRSNSGAALKLYRVPGDPLFSYRTTEDSTAIEVAIGLVELRSDASVDLTFSVVLSASTGSTAADFIAQAHAHYADSLGGHEASSNAIALPLSVERVGIALQAGQGIAQIAANGNPDGTSVVHFSARVRNYGQTPLFNVQVTDRLDDSGGAARLGVWTAQTAPQAGQYTIVPGSIRVGNVRGSAVIAAPVASFNGTAGNDRLLQAGAYLPVSGEFTIEFDARINFSGRSTLYNQATVSAARLPNSASSLSDVSIDGADPDPLGTGNPQSSASLTAIDPPPAVTIVKTAGVPRRIAGGVYEIDYALTVSNHGTVVAPHVRVADNLDCAIVQQTNGAVASWQLIGAPVAANGLLRMSSSYTGQAACLSPADATTGFPLSSAINLTDGTRALQPGQTEVIRFTVRIALARAGARVQISNRAWVGTFGDAGGIAGAGGGTAGEATGFDSLLIDPQGVVYDAVTRQAIAGAIVNVRRLSCRSGAASAITSDQIFDGASGLYTYESDGSVSMTTTSEGIYQFYWKSPPVTDLCTYVLSVAPPVGSRYVSPSTVIPPTAGTYSGCGNVVASALPPADADPTTYYTSVVSGYDGATGTACEALHNNIPLDPIGARVSVLLKKEGSRAEAEFGDFVDYTLTVSNRSGIPLPGVNFRDLLPPGFAYLSGTARFNGNRVADPTGGAGPQLSFDYPDYVLPTDGMATLRYRVRIGVGAPTNGDAINKAQAFSNQIASNEASWRVRVSGGVFSDDAFAFGKVFLDCDADGVQGGEGEHGIPGVRLFFEDGSNVISDAEGRWSLYGLKPITHVVRLDETTLPAGAVPIAIDHRNAGVASSRFLDLKKGELGKANFAIGHCSDPRVREAVDTRRHAAAAAGTPRLDAAVKARLNANGNATTSDTRALPASGQIGTASADQASPTRALIADTPAQPATMRLTDGTALLPSMPVDQAPPADHRDLEALAPTLDAQAGFIDWHDGDTAPSRSINVRVKGPQGASLRLQVNGVPLPESRVGKRVTVPASGVAVWEYIGVDLAVGLNRLALTVVDAMGNARESTEITVLAPDRLGGIQIQAPTNPRADANQPIDVRVHLVDANAVPVAARTYLTLESDAGRWLTPDLDPDALGVQVLVEHGQAVLRFEPPADPGPVHVRVSSGQVAKDAVIEFLPQYRPLIGIGVVEGVIDLGRRGKVPLGAMPAGSAFETELHGLSHQSSDGRESGRAAFYFKGAIKGEYLLTTAYDSDKTQRDVLFRDIQPDKYYPVYGDESTTGYDAQSSQKLYVRVDNDHGYLLYGDFTTASSPEVRQISQVSRSLSGLKHEYRTDDLRTTSFASRDSSTQQVEELRATGVSYYFLSGTGDIVENSEKVELLVRSRMQPQLVLSTRTLTRYADYSLDVLSKRLVLVNPVASFDSELNPQSIRISYEVDSGGESFVIAGVDVQKKMDERTQIGAVVVHDQNPQNERKLTAGTMLVRPNEATLITGEVVHTSTDDKGEGNAVRFDVRHEQDKLRVQVQIAKASPGFDNPSASISAGNTMLNGRAEYRIDEATRLRSEWLFNQSALSDAVSTERRSVAFAVQRKLSDYLVGEFGIRHGNEGAGSASAFEYGVISTASGTTGNTATPVTGAATQSIENTTTLRGRLSARLPDFPRTEIFGELEQDLDQGERHALALGGNYAITDRTRLYARHEFVSSLYEFDTASERTTTLVGIESAYMEGGRIYNEYRLATNGGQDATGVRNTFAVAPGLRLTGGFERTRVTSGSATASNGESTAITFGADMHRGPWRGSAAIENRDATDADSHLLSLGLAYRSNPDWTWLGRALSLVTDGATNGRHELSRLQIGAAWRPAATDDVNGLWQYEERYESIGANSTGGSSYSLYGGTATTPAGTYRNHILSGLLNVNPERGNYITGRYAAKVSTDDADGIKSSYWAQLLHGRYTRDIASGWDIGVQAGRLWGKGKSRRNTAGAELGYQVMKNLWLSFGYNFVGLRDADLAGANYTSQGAYLRLRIKFDERTLGLGEAAPAGSSGAVK